MVKNSEEKFIYTPVAKAKDAVKLWFCFPATYMIAMASLGYLHLFRLFDENSDIYPERVYTDTEKLSIPFKEIEMIGFSVSFEFDFLGIFSIMSKHNIPFRSKNRDDSFPIIFGGGPVLTANPEPFADFFDVIIIGEGEEVLNELIMTYKEIRKLPKKEQLIRLSQIEGVYVPSLYHVNYDTNGFISSLQPLTEDAPVLVKRRYIKNLCKSIHTPIITEKSVFPGMFLIETARGCPKRCKFCIASYLTLPSRYPESDNIMQNIDLGLSKANKIGLLGALITEHKDFKEICDYLLEKRKVKDFEVSVSSLRVDTITPKIIETLVKCGQKQTTIAIEAGSERLRTYIGKKLSEDGIKKGVKIASENGLSGLKLYGMIGLPSETTDDIKELCDLMIRLKKENKGFNLTLSVSSFVPKAQVPFQWEERATSSIIQQRNDYLRKELNKHKVIYKPTSIKWDYIQAVISRGDRRVSYLLEKVNELGGTIGSWARAHKELSSEINLPDLDWYALRKREFSEILPWNHIISSLSKESLYQDYLRNIVDEDSLE